MLETAFYLNAPSYFAENKDDDPSNDVYFVDYARTDAKELKPVAVYDTRIYSPAGSYDLKKYFPDADARIVAYDTGHGKAYVPASVLDGMFGKSYVDSLQLPDKGSMALFLSMPSQILELEAGARAVVDNSKDLDATISGATNGAGLVHVRGISAPVVIIGRYDSTPDNDLSDDKILAIQTPDYPQLLSIKSSRGGGPYFSDIQVLDPSEIDLPESLSLQDLPDATHAYQKAMGFWFGEFVQSLVDAENPDAIGLLKKLPMATERVEKGGFAKRTGWAYDLVALTDEKYADIGNRMEVRLNYGRDTPYLTVSLVFPLVSRNYTHREFTTKDGKEFDLGIRPASMGPFARAVLDKDQEALYFPKLGRIVSFEMLASSDIWDITAPGDSRNRTFEYLLYRGMRQLLGEHVPDDVVIYMPDKDGNIPGEDFTISYGDDEYDYRLFYSTSSAEADPNAMVATGMAFPNMMLYSDGKPESALSTEGIIMDLSFGKASYREMGPDDPMFGIPLKYLRQMGVKFVPVQEFSPDVVETPENLPVLLELDVLSSSKGDKFESADEFFQSAMAWTNVEDTVEVRGKPMKVGEISRQMIDSLPDGSLVVVENVGAPPLLVLMNEYIGNQDRDIGFAGRLIGKYYPKQKNPADAVYQDFYEPLLKGQIPDPFKELYYDSQGYSSKILVSPGFYYIEDPNPLYNDTYYTFEFNGEFGNTGRKFFVSLAADSEGGYFQHGIGLPLFAVTSKSTQLIPPWILPGLLTQQDMVEATGEDSVKLFL